MALSEAVICFRELNFKLGGVSMIPTFHLQLEDHYE
jgi:hypothetical protein